MHHKKPYLKASLRLSASALKHGGDVCTVEEALVDRSAYIVDEQNNTTAYALARYGKVLQVTFFPAPPPSVSFLTTFCTLNGAPTELISEPALVTTEGNLALFLMKHGWYRYKHDYYVYRAPGAAGGVLLMLEEVRHPEKQGLFLSSDSYYFHDQEVGLLRHKSRDDLDAYKIAALRTDDEDPRMSRCNLYMYDSQSKTWDRKTGVLADQRYKNQLATHHCSRVITIGGDAGTMGWVDLKQGIALCDVLGGKEDSLTSRLVRYIPLPDGGPVKKRNILRDTRRRFRTVAAVHGRIQYVEVQIHVRPGPRPKRLHGTYFPAGWTVVRWSTTAGKTRWRKDCQLSSSDITVPADMAALLPTLPRDIDEDATTLDRLHVGHPTISLGDDSDIVYFQAKMDEVEKDAWVIAVNTKKKVLQGVTEFAPRCVYSMDFTYMPTTISKYLTPACTKTCNKDK